jgi:hypothetical protein
MPLLSLLFIKQGMLCFDVHQIFTSLCYAHFQLLLVSVASSHVHGLECYLIILVVKCTNEDIIFLQALELCSAMYQLHCPCTP